eukprot:1157400-Pelagomonas_calceolata.AAC.5
MEGDCSSNAVGVIGLGLEEPDRFAGKVEGSCSSNAMGDVGLRRAPLLEGARRDLVQGSQGVQVQSCH